MPALPVLRLAGQVMKHHHIRAICAKHGTPPNRMRWVTLTKAERKIAQAKTGGTCHVCGGPTGKRWQADHLVPHHLAVAASPRSTGGWFRTAHAGADLEQKRQRVVLGAVKAAATEGRILGLREEHRRAITASMGRAAGNGHRVLDEQPIVSVTGVRELLGTTFPGANQIVPRLVDLKILAEITGQARHRRFRYDGYIRLFEEGTGL